LALLTRLYRDVRQQNIKYGLDVSFVERKSTFLVPASKIRIMRNEWSQSFGNISYKVWDMVAKCHMFIDFWYKNVTYFIRSLNQEKGPDSRQCYPFRDIKLGIFNFLFFLPKKKDCLSVEWTRLLSLHFIVTDGNIYKCTHTAPIHFLAVFSYSKYVQWGFMFVIVLLDVNLEVESGVRHLRVT